MKATFSKENGYRLYRTRGRATGWLVCICLLGKTHRYYFGDHTYGSPSLSRAAASQIAVHNSALHAEFRALRARFQVRSTSRSGIPGVTFLPCSRTRRAGWLAYWDDPVTRRRHNRFFATRKFGNDRAFELARAARHSAMAPLLERYHQLSELLSGQLGIPNTAE